MQLSASGYRERNDELFKRLIDNFTGVQDPTLLLRNIFFSGRQTFHLNLFKSTFVPDKRPTKSLPAAADTKGFCCFLKNHRLFTGKLIG